MEEHPREIRASPQLLAALAGCKHLHEKLIEALHESAVAACAQKRVRFLSLDHGLTVPATKRGGQEAPGYVVEGIFKRRWLEKVCNEIPAVIVVCFDWSAEVQPSPQEESQAIAHLQHIRRQAHSREIRLLVFLVVHPDTSDPDAAGSGLRQQPEVIGLIATRGSTEVAAKATRLERLIYQHAMAFYTDEEKRHRRQRTPSPSAPQWMANALQVRANIKIAYTCELRRDTRGALKSYIKAYEQLIHDTEIADVVERITLCNHITVRMYQLYLQSPDIGLAVHHCGIHTMTLRTCAAGERESVGAAALAWRKWHWLAANHQLFAELLENVVEQLPLLIDQTDMWQFPGFHYQSAATYVTQLKHWAATAGAASASPSGAGGTLRPSPFLGQAGRLERPSEVSFAAEEVAARCARDEVQLVTSGDRGLQLLIRAHAASKERDYKARTLVCTARMADEYLGEGNLPPAAKLYERLRQQIAPDTGDGKAAGRSWPVWPALRRLSLQRAISCSCRELKLKEPSLCSHGCSVALGGGAGLVGSVKLADGDTSEPVAQAEKEVVAAREEAARSRLLCDAFEYLSLNESCGQSRSPSIAKEHQHELLNVVEGILGAALPGLEVVFGAASAHVAFVRAGGEEAEVTGLTVILRSRLEEPLQVGRAVAVTSRGEVELQGLVNIWPQSWQGGQDLELSGTCQAPEGTSPPELSVSAIRVSWSPSSEPGAPSCNLLISDMQTVSEKAKPLLPSFQLPSASGSRHEKAAEEPVRPQPAATPFITKAFFPADPATVVVGERFIFHILLIRERGRAAGDTAALARKLSLSCTARLDEGSDEPAAAGDHSDEIRISLINRTSGDAIADGWPETALLPDAPSAAELVAELPGSGDGLRSAGKVLSFTADALADGPALCGDNEDVLVVPVMASCNRTCKASLSFSVTCSAVDGIAVARTIPGPQVSLTFRTGLQVGFEDRFSGAMDQGKVGIRKVSVRCVSAAPIEILRVATQPGNQAALGVPGRIAPQAAHSFALAPGATGGALSIFFHRADAVSHFFPWPQSRAALPASPLPSGASEWPLPSEPPKQAPAAMGTLQVELKHGATGMVAESIEIQVFVRRTTQSIQELRVQVLQEPNGGGASEQFFLGGPTTTQAVLISVNSLEPQVCSTFSLVPLKPGWIQVPRVQVSTGNQEVASTSSSIFIFPSTQPTIWRNNG